MQFREHPEIVADSGRSATENGPGGFSAEPVRPVTTMDLDMLYRSNGVKRARTMKMGCALLAAEVTEATAYKVTPRCAAKLLGVSVAYVYAALRTTEDERWEIRTGKRPLVLPASKAEPRIALPVPTSDPWKAGKDLVDKFGPGLVFDELIVPAIS